MATVWVALAVEAVVLLSAASAAVKWVRQAPASRPGQQLVESVAPLVEKPA